jgi:hypothetical protein
MLSVTFSVMQSVVRQMSFLLNVVAPRLGALLWALKIRVSITPDPIIDNFGHSSGVVFIKHFEVNFVLEQKE